MAEKKTEPVESTTKVTKYIKKHNLIRTVVYVDRLWWDQFQRAVDIENSSRQEGMPRLSRSKLIVEFIKRWTEKRIGEPLPDRQ